MSQPLDSDMKFAKDVRLGDCIWVKVRSCFKPVTAIIFPSKMYPWEHDSKALRVEEDLWVHLLPLDEVRVSATIKLGQ